MWGEKESAEEKIMEKKYNYVYKIRNKLNDMEYIGVHSTDNLDDEYFGSGIYLKNAIKKYGKENFEKHIIEHYDSRKEALNKEKEIVCVEYVRDKKVYNLVLGGGTIYGRGESIHKFKKGEETQLFIDFSNGLQDKELKQDYENIRIFCVDEYELQNYKKEIEAQKIYYELHYPKDVGSKLRIMITEFAIDTVYDMCKILTNYWNDNRYHKEALGMYKNMLSKNWCNLSNTSIIRIKNPNSD